MEESDARQSIYKASRTIKRKDNSLYNALKSIYEDSIFIGEISELWPELPLVANLRCGLWYSPKFEATCYFKSTDGHCNNWSFNTSRLNLHIAHLAGQKGGCIIVDSTRKGKRFPDSMAKTIPIWACVFNRAIRNYLRKMHLGVESEANTLTHDNADREDLSIDWDCSLHLPVWVSKTEKASIEDRLEEWTKELEASGVDIGSVATALVKPLRPLWISQKTIIWLNEVPDYDSWDFTPIILVSASSSIGIVQQRTTSEFSWNYISGAGDDEESWARGLSPSLFWKHVYDIISSGPDPCNQKVADIVEKDRVYRAHRGQNAPQITIKHQKLPASNGIPNEYHVLDSNTDTTSTEGNSTFSWLGSTNIAVGTSEHAENVPNGIDCILNCDNESDIGCDANLHLPIVEANTLTHDNADREDLSIDWDCSLHLPVWVSKTEKASIEDRLEEWTKELEASGVDIGSVATALVKPLRPLWISQKTIIWLNEVPDYDSWDFTPIILVSASSSIGIVQQRTTSEFSWNYISGAGDDEESWARGLSPSLFWKHVYDIISSGPDPCNQKVADIVEKDRVYRAHRGQNAPQITIKHQKLPASNGIPNEYHVLDSNTDTTSTEGNSTFSWLGSTNIAVGTSEHAENVPNGIDCILNCDNESDIGCDANLHLPIVSSKLDRFSLLSHLPSALNFAKLNLSKGKTVLVCCRTGEDISVCVCLAILTSLFNDEGSYDDGKSFKATCINKWEMRKRLVFICRFATNARPSRGNLRQVFSFLNKDTINSFSQQM